LTWLLPMPAYYGERLALYACSMRAPATDVEYTALPAGACCCGTGVAGGISGPLLFCGAPASPASTLPALPAVATPLTAHSTCLSLDMGTRVEGQEKGGGRLVEERMWEFSCLTAYRSAACLPSPSSSISTVPHAPGTLLPSLPLLVGLDLCMPLQATTATMRLNLGGHGHSAAYSCTASPASISCLYYHLPTCLLHLGTSSMAAALLSRASACRLTHTIHPQTIRYSRLPLTACTPRLLPFSLSPDRRLEKNTACLA